MQRCCMGEKRREGIEKRERVLRKKSRKAVRNR
jgi:hypothetical protein